MNNKKWHIKEAINNNNYASALVDKVLQTRNMTIKEIEQFMTADYRHDAFLMHDMQKAVDRIHLAIEQDEPIMIYGDYDADGVTSTAILYKTLESLGAMVDYYIPNRFIQGYGPNSDAFEEIANSGVSVIITVDNGIQGHAEIDFVNKLGVDVILTDHHEIGDTLPNAYATVHPAHPDATYPCPFLAGVGVSYKLCCALLNSEVPPLLPLVAIGTISDLVPLANENRTLVKLGLEALNNDTPLGIQALLNSASHQGNIDEETVGFIIGPRLNAVGRLGDARLACDLLLEGHEASAMEMAYGLEAANTERKSIVNDITTEALNQASDKVRRGLRFLVITGEEWNEGVLGIVASKIVETYYLPTLVLNLNHEQGNAKGSGRSVPQISMYHALNSERALLDKFGGHDMAAGLTLSLQNVDELELKLSEWLDKEYPEPLTPELLIDARVDLSDITVQNIQDLDLLRPFGTGNNKPIFSLEDVQVTDSRAIGQEGKHLKLMLNKQLAALMWNEGHLNKELPVDRHINVCGTFQLNEWNGNVSPQMILQDIALKDERITDYRNQHPSTFKYLKDEKVVYVINDDAEKLNDDYYYYGETIPNNLRVVLRDLPNDLTKFKHTINNLNVHQLYVIFYTKQSIYFEGMPTVAQFRELYKLLINKQTNLIQSGMSISKRVGVTPSALMFMIEVLKDLNVVLGDDVLEINLHAGKVDIPTSNVYLSRLEKLKIEQQLLYASLDELKQVINGG